MYTIYIERGNNRVVASNTEERKRSDLSRALELAEEELLWEGTTSVSIIDMHGDRVFYELGSFVTAENPVAKPKLPMKMFPDREYDEIAYRVNRRASSLTTAMIDEVEDVVSTAVDPDSNIYDDFQTLLDIAKIVLDYNHVKRVESE